MNRLTNKTNTQIMYGDDTPYAEIYVAKDDTMAIQKLGKLEDIEEEIGCPIDVVFKALKNGIYTLNRFGKMVHLTFEDISIRYEHIYHYDGDEKVFKYEGLLIGSYDEWCFLKHYKKTWWLREDKSE